MKNKILLIILLLVLAGVAGMFLFGKGANFEINKENPETSSMSSASATPVLSQSPISGLACADANRRPLAVMLADDAIVRPLAGLSEADLVVEMPVITGSINRLMAIFVCGNPKEIGSVRSARHDFIPLARGWDAIFVHWGGSHFALDKLNAGVMDNIDALKDSGDVFYRKTNLPAPHNGFTSMKRLWAAAQKLGYRAEGQFGGYSRLSELAATTTKTLFIGFPGEFTVKYVYDSASNSYLRWRGGTKEIDRNNGQQVAAKNVVAMIAQSRQIEGQYNDVDIEGEGKVKIYRNGEEVIGAWKKDAKNQNSKLYFYDSAGQEIKFVPGQIWVEIIEPGESIIWQ